MGYALFFIGMSNKYKLKSGWSAQRGEGYILFASDLKNIKLKLNSEIIDNFFEGHIFLVPNESFDETIQALINDLIKKGLLEKGQPDIQKSLQTAYFSHVSNKIKANISKIKSSNILILGLGGTGSIIIEQLVSAGISNFILVDCDQVEKSNLERQLIYTNASVGKRKVDEVEEYIKTRNDSAKIEKNHIRINSSEDFKDFLKTRNYIDFCAVCIDEPYEEIYDITSSLLWKYDIPFIHGGVMIRSGFWGPLFSKDYSSNSPEKFSIWSENKYSQKPLKVCFSPFNAIIANFMVSDILHFLADCPDMIDFNSRTFLNFLKMEFTKIEGCKD